MTTIYLVCDGVLEVLLWLPFPSIIPPLPLLKWLSVTVKVLLAISIIFANSAIRYSSSLSPTSHPKMHQKIINTAMNSVGSYYWGWFEHHLPTFKKSPPAQYYLKYIRALI